MYSRTFRILAVLTVLVTLVTACAPSATPAPQPGQVEVTRVVTAAPVVVTAPSVKQTVVVTAPPPPAPAAVPAAPKWCSNVNIVFFPGGPQGGVFAVNVYNGAVQAQNDLGPKVNYVWSDWDPQKMIQ